MYTLVERTIQPSGVLLVGHFQELYGERPTGTDGSRYLPRDRSSYRVGGVGTDDDSLI